MNMFYFVSMIQRLCLFLFFLLPAIPCSAQLPLNMEHYADSLYNVLKESKSDSIKARTHYKLIYYWMPKDMAKAKQHLEEGRRLSKKYPYLEAISYASEGYFYYAGDMEKSETAYFIADSLLSRFDTKESYITRANIWINCGVIQQRKNNDKAYIDIVLNKVIPFATKGGDSALVGSQYAGVGVAFMNTEQYDKAESYFIKAIDILKLANAAPSRLVSAYNRLGETYMYLQKYAAAKATLDAVEIILAPYPESELYAGHYLVQGMYNHYLKQYVAAVASFDKGIAAANGPNKAYIIQELSFLKAKSLVEDKRFEPARQVLTSLSKDEEVLAIDDNRLQLYALLAKSHAGLGQMKAAYEWQALYSGLNDSLYKSRLTTDINALELKYQGAEKEKRIAVLEAGQQQALLTAKNQRLTLLLLGIASIFLLISTAFLIFYYRNSKKLAQQKEINYRQQLKEIEQQQQLKRARAVLEGVESERRRIARDLHDGLGGMLAGIKIRLSSQTTAANPAVDGAIRQLDQSLTELRRIARNLMPESLLKLGLEAALGDLCESFMSERTVIEFQAYGIQRDMDLGVQVNIYRIVQEALSNAIRHSQAEKIILQCSQNEDTFFITVEDNGKGFDLAAIEKAPGIGFSSIKNRVEYMKGKLDITAAINEGTTINIELNVSG